MIKKGLKRVKQLINSSSHLAAYLPYMQETKEMRVIRLISDNSMKQMIPAIKHSHERSYEGSLRSTNGLLDKWKILLSRLRVFIPTHLLSLLWFFLLVIVYIYYYVEMGLVLTFGMPIWNDELNSSAYLAVDSIAILILCLDILFCFNCGYLYRGMIVMERERIISNYLRRLFFIDVLTILILILCPATGYFPLNWAKMILLFKVVRMFEIDDYFLRRLNLHRKSKAGYVIFKLVIIIFLLSHMVGLIFYAMDEYFLLSGYYAPDFCWLISSTAYSPIYELDYDLKYLYTLYWGVNTITTISYGDIAPLNPIETNYSIVCFCFGFMVYGYVVNQIVKIILWAREHEDQFQNELVLLDTYMEKMSINEELKKDIHDYLYFLHREEKNRDLAIETSMKDKLPEGLRIELLKSAYEVFYDKMLSIFKTVDVIKIFFHLTEKKFTSNETVFQQGDRPTYLVYLVKGEVKYELEHGELRTEIYRTQSNNELMGHLEIFIRDRWAHSAVTTSPSLIYMIDRLKLMEEINKNLLLKERFKLIEQQLIYKKKMISIFLVCYFCHKQHYFLQCPQKFPNLSIDTGDEDFDRRVNTQALPVRYSKNKSSALKNYRQFNSIRKLKMTDNYKMIVKVEKRLMKIKKKILQRNREFEIDAAHDWSIYQPDWNLSKLKESWNRSLEERNNEKMKKQIESDQQ